MGLAPQVWLRLLDAGEMRQAQATMILKHYLGTPVDRRCQVEGYGVMLAPRSTELVGYLLVGRPEATRCYPWYGSLQDVVAGKAACSYWEVLNLARVWLSPLVQRGGAWCTPDRVPGFVDRQGVWHSTLASTALRLLVAQVGFDYLARRPPCFLEEPYQIRWLLSYQDPARHRGVIYQAAGWERYRSNRRGLITWRTPLPSLTTSQDVAIRHQATYHQRSIQHRTRRAARTLVQQTLF